MDELVQEIAGKYEGCVLLADAYDNTMAVAVTSFVVERELHIADEGKSAPKIRVEAVSSAELGAPVVLVDEGKCYTDGVEIIRHIMDRFPHHPPHSEEKSEDEFDDDSALEEAQYFRQRAVEEANQAEKIRYYVESASRIQENCDNLLKYTGFCQTIPSAAEYRWKGATRGDGLNWVQGELEPIHLQLLEYEEALSTHQFLCGESSLLASTGVYLSCCHLCLAGCLRCSHSVDTNLSFGPRR